MRPEILCKKYTFDAKTVETVTREKQTLTSHHLYHCLGSTGKTVQFFQEENMTIANSAEYRIARLVDELFSTGRYGELFENPVTGDTFMYGVDDGDFRIKPQKEKARRALLAREHFSRVGPPELQPLPLSWHEISYRKYDWATGASAEVRALAFISSRFADSLRENDWDYKRHPSFDDYVRGVLASKHPDLDNLPSAVRFDFIALHKRYPPRPLPGLQLDSHLTWRSPARTKRAA